jgi:hypothetical protein
MMFLFTTPNSPHDSKAAVYYTNIFPSTYLEGGGVALSQLHVQHDARPKLYDDSTCLNSDMHVHVLPVTHLVS